MSGDSERGIIPHSWYAAANWLKAAVWAKQLSKGDTAKENILAKHVSSDETLSAEEKSTYQTLLDDFDNSIKADTRSTTDIAAVINNPQSTENIDSIIRKFVYKDKDSIFHKIKTSALTFLGSQEQWKTASADSIQPGSEPQQYDNIGRIPPALRDRILHPGKYDSSGGVDDAARAMNRAACEYEIYALVCGEMARQEYTFHSLHLVVCDILKVIYPRLHGSDRIMGERYKYEETAFSVSDKVFVTIHTIENQDGHLQLYVSLGAAGPTFVVHRYMIATIDGDTWVPVVTTCTTMLSVQNMIQIIELFAGFKEPTMLRRMFVYSNIPEKPPSLKADAAEILTSGFRAEFENDNAREIAKGEELSRVRQFYGACFLAALQCTTTPVYERFTPKDLEAVVGYPDRASLLERLAQQVSSGRINEATVHPVGYLRRSFADEDFTFAAAFKADNSRGKKMTTDFAETLNAVSKYGGKLEDPASYATEGGKVVIKLAATDLATNKTVLIDSTLGPAGFRALYAISVEYLLPLNLWGMVASIDVYQVDRTAQLMGHTNSIEHVKKALQEFIPMPTSWNAKLYSTIGDASLTKSALRDEDSLTNWVWGQTVLKDSETKSMAAEKQALELSANYPGLELTEELQAAFESPPGRGKPVSDLKTINTAAV